MSVRTAGLAQYILPAAGLLLVAAQTPLSAGVALTEEHFDDPFAYCETVGTINAPDRRYVGPAMPEAVVRGLKAALALPVDASTVPLRGNSIWRCMNGQVYACTVGANLPCAEKADTRREPAVAVADFCHRNPDADIIPMSVTGRATVFEWRCAGALPAIARQIAQPDAAGYLANIWYPISSAMR